MTICERLFSTLDEKGLKAAGLCRVLGIGTNITTGWKQRNTDPPAKYIAPICEYLGCSIEFLLTGREPQGTKKELTQEMTPDELEVLELFRALPYKEQQRAIGRLQTLVEVSQENNPQKAIGAQSSGGKAV